MIQCESEASPRSCLISGKCVIINLQSFSHKKHSRFTYRSPNSLKVVSDST